MSILIAALLAQAAHPAALDPAISVKALIDAEQSAFFAGECEKVVTHWSEDLVMVVEGEKRASSTTELLELCRNVMKMVAAGQIPSGTAGPKVIERNIEMLSENIAYETVLRMTPAGAKSSVTKLLVRGENGWKITRMHEAIARAPASQDAR